MVWNEKLLAVVHVPHCEQHALHRMVGAELETKNAC